MLQYNVNMPTYAEGVVEKATLQPQAVSPIVDATPAPTINKQESQHWYTIASAVAHRYPLPTQCAITHDDLIQEACLALLEASTFEQPCMDDREAYAIARKAMQRAISRYTSPVTHSLDTELYTDDNGVPITLADTLVAALETDLTEHQMRDDLLDSASAFLSSLNTQLAAGTITPANYRKKKQRFLHKLRKSVSQNLS